MARDKFSDPRDSAMQPGFSAARVLAIHRRKTALLRKLLRENQFNFSQIAARVGVSRDRVHLIATQMGISGRQREFERALERIEAKFQDSLSPAVLSVIDKCAALGIPCDFLGDGGRHGMYTDRLLVNGHLCPVRTMSHHPKGENYLRFYAPRIAFDFAIYHSPVGFFILPWHLLRGIKATMFNVRPEQLRSRDPLGRCHDYPHYWEAWHLLRRKKK